MKKALKIIGVILIALFLIELIINWQDMKAGFMDGWNGK